MKNNLYNWGRGERKKNCDSFPFFYQLCTLSAVWKCSCSGLFGSLFHPKGDTLRNLTLANNVTCRVQLKSHYINEEPLGGTVYNGKKKASYVLQAVCQALTTASPVSTAPVKSVMIAPNKDLHSAGWASSSIHEGTICHSKEPKGKWIFFTCHKQHTQLSGLLIFLSPFQVEY